MEPYSQVTERGQDALMATGTSSSSTSGPSTKKADDSYSKKAIAVEIDLDEAFLTQTFLAMAEPPPYREYMEYVFTAAAKTKAPLTAAARKKRLEVQERYLSAPEKELFRQAKAKEWQSWVANRVVRMIDGHGINPHRIIRSRWVLTWKTDAGSGDKVAKARLVLLGYEDPDLGSYLADAPTLSRPGKYIILATASIQMARLHVGRTYRLSARRLFDPKGAALL